MVSSPCRVIYLFFNMHNQKNFGLVLSMPTYIYYMAYMAKPEHKRLYPGVMNFTILVDPSYVIITIYINCMIHAQE